MNKNFKHAHIYKMESLYSNKYDYYIFIKETNEEKYFIDINTGKVLAEDFIGSDYLEEI